jgi:purine-nucleoside/S-methyl-5'-thioadenosine phosphorylase / adenosine deaminase
VAPQAPQEGRSAGGRESTARCPLLFELWQQGDYFCVTAPLKWAMMGHMEWHAHLPHLRFEALAAHNVPHAITTREWGSLNPFVSYEVERRLQAAITSAPNPPLGKRLVIAEEVHGADAHVCSPTDGGSIRLGVDGLISNDPSLILMVYASDCVPLLFFDPVQNVVAALHGGRRSLIKGLIAKTASLMEDRYGSAMGDVLVGIGPALRVCCYEIQKDIFPDLEAAGWMDFVTDKNGSLRLDMIAGCKSLLLSSGMAEEHIEDSRLCTVDDSLRFFSSRNRLAADERSASFAALISVPDRTR